MMNNLTERDKRTLKMGGIAAGAILLFMVIGRPLMDRWSDVNKEVDDAKSKWQSIQSKYSDALEVQTKIKDLKAIATIHQDPTDLNQQTPQLVQQIETLPNYKAITVKRMEGLPIREEDLFYRSAVSLQFQGTLGDLHKFLQDVEKSRPGLKVERMSLAEDSKETGKVDGQMVISAYAVVLKKGNTG